MVEGLAERLKKQPQDIDGWSRLIGAYVTLGETAKARTALVDARAALPPADATAKTALDALARKLETTP
jgi:cytochrome c-type biogenesis protein CcmH